MEISLNNNQKLAVEGYIKKFKEYVTTKDYKNDIKGRKERESFFLNLTEEKIKNLSELELGEMVSKLWATQMWSNKDYKIQKILNDNGLDNLRKHFHQLFFGKEAIGDRLKKFYSNVKHLGPSSVTELLCFFRPNEYGVWNDKARQALKVLGFDDLVALHEYRISGQQYNQFILVLKEIDKMLKRAGFDESDLLFVDYFLYTVWADSRKLKEVSEKEMREEFDHDEIRDKIVDIGAWLGFESESERTIGAGAKVDVIWSARIGNLGVVTYVFEVHKSGSMDSLLLNLQKSKSNPTVQKVIAVSDRNQLEKIQRETTGLPPDFIDTLSIWDTSEVEMVHQYLSEVTKSIDKLGLVRSQFEVDKADEISSRKTNKARRR